MAEHRHQRHDPRPARDEQERTAERCLPYEVAADRAAQLESIARPQLVDEIRRDLAVLETLDGDGEPRVLRSRSNRIAPLGLITILGSQSHVHVLACAMPRPLR